jgi:hypothetical protein
MATLPTDCYCAGWERLPGEPSPGEAHHPGCPVPREEARLAEMDEDEPGLVLPSSGVVLPSAASFAEVEPTEDPPDVPIAEQLKPYFERVGEDDELADDARIDTCEQCSAEIDAVADAACPNCGRPISKAIRMVARHPEFDWTRCPEHGLWFIAEEGDCPQCNPMSEARTTGHLITWQEHKAAKATHPEPAQTNNGHAPPDIARDHMGRPIFMRNEAGEPVCGARRRRTAGRTDEDVVGKFCMSKNRCANGRCPDDGGLTPAGFASPHYKGEGKAKPRYLAGLRIDLQQIYEDALVDPELTALGEEIAAASAMLDSLNKQYADGGDGGALWKQLKEIFQMISLAKASTDVKARNRRIANLLNKAAEIVGRGDLQFSTRGEIKNFTDLLRKLKSAEAKRQRELQLMMPVAEAMNVYTSLTEAVVTNLSDNSLFAPIEGAAQQVATLIANDAPKEDILRALRAMKELVGNVSTRPILSRIETDFRRIVGHRKGERNPASAT